MRTNNIQIITATIENTNSPFVCTPFSEVVSLELSITNIDLETYSKTASNTVYDELLNVHSVIKIVTKNKHFIFNVFHTAHVIPNEEKTNIKECRLRAIEDILDSTIQMFLTKHADCIHVVAYSTPLSQYRNSQQTLSIIRNAYRTLDNH